MTAQRVATTVLQSRQLRMPTTSSRTPSSPELLTGTIYGLMALGPVRHLRRHAARQLRPRRDDDAGDVRGGASAFQGLSLDPFVAMLGAAVAVRRARLRAAARVHQPLRHRPEHAQMLLMIALAIIIGERAAAGLRSRRAQRADRATSSIRSSSGPLLVDKARVYAAVAAIGATAAAGGVLPLHAHRQGHPRLRRQPARRARRRACPSRTCTRVTFGIGAACVAVAGCAMVLLIDVTPAARPGLHAARPS